MVSVERFKLYARLDTDDEDTLLEPLINTARSAVQDMTGKVEPEQDELYDMAVLLLATHFYENRTPIQNNAIYDVPFSLSCLLHDIALSSRYEKVVQDDGSDK